MRNLQFHITILLLVVASMSSAQQVWLDGSVTDIEGKPLPDISVLAYKVGTRIIVAYTATNADGKYGFGVSAETDSLDVGVNSLFFEKQRHRIANRTQTVDFVLREEVQQLKGVTVQASPIEQRGDTLEYFVGSFVQKQDKTIEDVLKRMPGIEVEDNGKITYQGLPIQKFYVEGMDLMGNGYTQVSKNLPHQSVSSVEVYENHQPIKLLEDRVSSEQASINIKLSKDVTLTGTGKMALGAAPFLWNLNLAPMLFSNKVQLLASYKTNNTGNDLTGFLQYEAQNQSDSRPQQMGEDLSIKAASTPLFNSQRYLDNCSHLVNLNALTPISDKVNLRVNLYYLNDLQKQVAGQSNTLFIADDTITYYEDIDNRYRDNRLFGTIILNRNDKSVYLDEKFNFSRSWDNAMGVVNNGGTLVHQDLHTPFSSVSNNFRVVFPMGKQLIDFTSCIGYGHAPHRLSIEPGQFAGLLNDSLGYGSTTQALDSRQVYADNTFSGIFSIRRFTIRPKVGLLFEQRNVISQLRLAESGDVWMADAVSDAQIVRSNLKPYFNTMVEYTFKGLTLKLDLPLSLPFMRVRNERGQGDKLNRLFFDPSLYVKQKLGNFWTLSTSVQWCHVVDNYDSWMSCYVLTDYQSLVLRNAPLAPSKNLSGDVGLEFKQPFISLNANTRYGAGITYSEMMYRYDVDDDGATSIEVFAMPNQRFYQTLTGSICKYFSSIRTSIGLKGMSMDSRGVSFVNGCLLNNESFSFTLSPKVMLRVTEWMNIDYSLNCNQLYSYVDKRQRNKITYCRHFVNAYGFIDRRNTLSMSAEYYSHQGKPYFFMDFCYQFSIQNPKLDFELRWNNIFNSKKYVSYYSGVFSVQETVYRLRPMEITASVHFRF